MALYFDEATRTLWNSDYARLFGPENKHWSSEPAHNDLFLQMMLNWFNDKLQAQGHLFLNEVYDALGFPRTPMGQIIGWVRDEGQKVEFRLTKNEGPKLDDSVMIEINVDSSAMNHKI